MKRILLCLVVFSNCGCGTMTCMDVARLDPQTKMIFGGVRTDVNCVITGDERWEELAKENHQPANKYLLKTVCALDVPLSLAADTLMLPYAIWWTLQSKNQSLKEEDALTNGDEENKSSDSPTPQAPAIQSATRKLNDER